jgi:photosystem II stability/assembly factor-like uncharacterized protein
MRRRSRLDEAGLPPCACSSSAANPAAAKDVVYLSGRVLALEAYPAAQLDARSLPPDFPRQERARRSATDAVALTGGCSMFSRTTRLCLLFAAAAVTVTLVVLSSACRAGTRLPAKTPAAKMGVPQFIWEPIGLSGGGGMFSPAISPVDPDFMMLSCDMSGAYVSTDGGRRWTMINHLQLQGNTRCKPGFHPKDRNTVYMVDGWSGTLMVSHDRGVAWTAVGTVPGGTRGEIKLDPDYADTMLIGADDGCSISRDGGKTWTHCSGPTGPGLGFAFDRRSPAAARVIFTATEQGLWRSADGGKTWARQVNGLPWTEIRSFAGASNPKTGETMLYCSVTSKIVDGGFGGGVWRSRDGGEHWESAMKDGINTETRTYDEWADGPIAQYTHVLAADAKPRTVYAVNTSTGFWPPHNPGVFRSDDAGNTWRQTMYMDPRFTGQYNLAPDYFTATQHRSDQGGAFGAAIANSDPERVIHVGGIVWITHNGGRTWEAAHTALAPGQQPGPGAAWVCNGLVVTTTWHYYVDPFQPNRHYIAYTDIGFARSLDAGKTWIWWPEQGRSPWSNTCYELAFDPDAPGKMWGAFSNTHDIPNDNIISGRHGSQYPGGVCQSTDFGATWRAAEHGLPARACTSIVLDPTSPKGARTLYASFFEEGVFKSTDDGATWTKIGRGLGAPEDMRVYRLIRHQDGTLFALVTAKRQGGQYVTQGPGLYRSRDGGENWECITTSLGLLWPKDFAVSPRSSQLILIGAADARAGQAGLYRSADGGRTWQRVLQKGPEHFGASFDPARPGWVYATLTEGCPGPSLWLSRDDGLTWERAQPELPFANTQRVQFDPNDPNVIYVTTFGGSVWRGRMK